MPQHQPLSILDAFEALAQRAPRPSPMDSAQWQRIAPDIRAKSFFSSRVESARFLDRAKGLMLDFLASSREEVRPGVFALKVGSRSQFVQLMRDFMVAEGMATEDEIRDIADDRDITDIRSQRRLDLIFDTNVNQANGYSYHAQGLDPIILEAFPAARFVRIPGAREPRLRHVASEGDVRLKTDTAYWAEFQNAASIGGFEVPWPPYGFNSFMDQEDVSRADAQRLGLIAAGEAASTTQSEAQRAAPPTANLKASIRNMDPETREKLLTSLRTRSRDARDPGALAAEAAAQAREEAATRTRDASIERGDTAETDRINAALAQEEEMRLDRDTGEVFEVAVNASGDLNFLN